MGTTSPLNFPYPSVGDPLTNWRTDLQLLAEALDDYLTALAAVAAVGYTDLTLNSGWTNVSGSEKTQYARGAGHVTVALAALKANFSAGDSLGILPVGFRPPRPIRVAGSFNAAARFFTIGTSGAITSDATTTGGIVGHASFQI